jgi:hypothetical protein
MNVGHFTNMYPQVSDILVSQWRGVASSPGVQHMAASTSNGGISGSISGKNPL